MNKEKMLEIVRLVLILSLAMIMSSMVEATSTPKGVDGKVYHLDGFTEVHAGIPVLIKNIDTDQEITVYTGKGTSGRYSVALQWNGGERINVTAYNPLHNSSRNITLTGIIHGFDILLNMTLPNYAPIITSEPNTTTRQEELYAYQVTYFDWNDDEANCSLSEYPGNMSIDSSGLVTWVPNSSFLGEYTVIIQCDDGEDIGTQEFIVKVLNRNYPPLIQGASGLEVRANELFAYEIIAEDPDFNIFSYELISGPSGMYVSDVILYWTPSSGDVGLHEFTVRVTDLDGEYAEQNYTVNVLPALPSQQGGGGSSSAREYDDFYYIESDSSLNERIISRILLDQSARNMSIFIGLMPFVSKEKILERFVYSYMEIRPDASYDYGAKIFFSVDKKWVQNRNLSKEDIVLLRYDSSWQELETIIFNETETHYTYESHTPGFSLFAISHKLSAHPVLEEPSVVETKESFTILGKINARLDVSEINISIFEIETNTWHDVSVFMLPSGEIRYQATINSWRGNNVIIYFNGEKVKEILLNDSLMNIDINYRQGLLGNNEGEPSGFFIITLSIIAFVILIIYIFSNKKTAKK